MGVIGDRDRNVTVSIVYTILYCTVLYCMTDEGCISENLLLFRPAPLRDLQTYDESRLTLLSDKKKRSQT